MPTPSDETPSLLSSPTDILIHRTQHTTCPPDEDREPNHSPEASDRHARNGPTADNAPSPPAQQPTPASESSDSVSAEINDATKSLAKRMDIDEDGPLRDTPSPMSSATESKDHEQQSSAASQALTSSSTTIPYASLESPWVGQHRVYISILDMSLILHVLTTHSSSPIRPPHTCDRAANFVDHNNPIDRYMTCRWKSNTSTWQNHFFAATSAFKVRHQAYVWDASCLKV